MSSATTAAEAAASSGRTRLTGGGDGQLGPVLRRLLRQPGVVVGAVILLLLIVGAVFAPYLTPYEPARMSPREALQPPSLAHPLGTDHFGRDQLARILYGGALSLQVGLVAVAIGASIGVTLGAIAGYQGGWIDEIISRLIDVKLAFPGILLALGVVAVLGPDLMNLMIAVGVGTIPGFCPAGARPGAGRPRVRLRAGGADARLPARADRRPPHPAERDRAGGGVRHPRGGRRDPGRRLLELPRAWARSRRRRSGA